MKWYPLNGFGVVVVLWHVMSLYHSASMRSLNVRPGIYCSLYPGVYRKKFGSMTVKRRDRQAEANGGAAMVMVLP